MEVFDGRIHSPFREHCLPHCVCVCVICLKNEEEEHRRVACFWNSAISYMTVPATIGLARRNQISKRSRDQNERRSSGSPTERRTNTTESHECGPEEDSHVAESLLQRSRFSGSSERSSATSRTQPKTNQQTKQISESSTTGKGLTLRARNH